MNRVRFLEILKSLCDLPTAPYCEGHVIAWLLAWAESQRGAIRTRRDGAGNVYLEYKLGRVEKGTVPLVIEAHMDHPGFIVQRQRRDGRIEAEFRGGVRPSHFQGARAKFWMNDPIAVGSVAPVQANGRWVPARVEKVKQIRGKRFLQVTLSPVKEKLPKGTLGMWDLPDAEVGGKGKDKGQLFSARVCDDIAGVAAIVCLLEELVAKHVEAHVIGLCSRAEEVGFAGVLAVCEKGWVPKKAAIIGLETSKAMPAMGGGAQGAGPIIRVGDRTGLFSPGLTYFLAQTAGHLADEDSAFKYQRKLMDGGTCNSTAFLAWGYDAAALCVALGNYHNMTVKGEVGWDDGGKAGKGIASETIHIGDFLGMVRLLVEAVKRFGTYKPGFGVVRDRFAKMHREEQEQLLYTTSDQT
jgi:endoglucanase